MKYLKCIIVTMFFALMSFSNPVFSETKTESTWSNYHQLYEGIPALDSRENNDAHKVYVCLDYATSFPWVIYKSPEREKGELVCKGNTFGPAEFK